MPNWANRGILNPNLASSLGNSFKKGHKLWPWPQKNTFRLPPHPEKGDLKPSTLGISSPWLRHQRPICVEALLAPAGRPGPAFVAPGTHRSGGAGNEISLFARLEFGPPPPLKAPRPQCTWQAAKTKKKPGIRTPATKLSFLPA